MWPIIYSINKALSIILTGIVIKIMDDYLDREIDGVLGRTKNPQESNDGSLPYALLILSLACTLDVRTSASLFLASFTVGMAGNFTAIMPTGLYGYQESLGGFLLGMFIFGYRCFVSSVIILLTLQLLDDYLDHKEDWALKNNWRFILGSVECLLLTAILFLASLYFDVFKSVAVVLSYFMIVFSKRLWSAKIQPH